MNCPKCTRKVTANRKTCLYCGAPLNRQSLSKDSFVMSNGNGFYVQSEKSEKIDLSDLPSEIRSKVEDAFRRGENEVILHDESRTVEYPLDGTVDNRAELSIEDTLSLLAGIRDSYKERRIKLAEYEHMVLDILQNYLASFDNREKINFVVNGVLDSKLMLYLSDGLLKKLRGSIIESVSIKL